jgi:hypothetical protein
MMHLYWSPVWTFAQVYPAAFRANAQLLTSGRYI